MFATPIDIAASYARFDTESGYTQYHAGLAMWKVSDDLDRYRKAIEACQPEVLVETGTKWGGFAAWAADTFGLDVVTVDVRRVEGRPDSWPQVTFVAGDSMAPATTAQVASMVAGHRCMVSLDADHHAGHVMREIELYSAMVTPGCYLVVEDGLADLVAPKLARRIGCRIPEEGGPLRAIEASTLTIDPTFERDLDIEAMTLVSHNPAGWWRRRVL
jgi:cephalosporin hydroxylase